MLLLLMFLLFFLDVVDVLIIVFVVNFCCQGGMEDRSEREKRDDSYLVGCK